MRLRSVICGFLILVLFCAPFQAEADTLDLSKSGIRVINSLAFAGLKKDLVIFPDDIQYIADDAFLDAQFTGTGKTGSYAYHWCISHGFSWARTETTSDGQLVDKEVNYSGRTTWQRFVQKHFMKATVINNKTGPSTFEADKVRYNIRMTFHIDEIYDRANEQSRLNAIEIMLKGWNGPDEEDNLYSSFEKDTAGYETVYRADWISAHGYNVAELMYDEWGNVAMRYDEESGENVPRYNHLDMRPEVWEEAVISINTQTHMLSIYHPGDLERNYQTYDLLEMYRAGYVDLTMLQTNLIIDPDTNQPYKKLRVKITASFNDTCRIALHESVIDNVFVSVVDRD